MTLTPRAHSVVTPAPLGRSTHQTNSRSFFNVAEASQALAGLVKEGRSLLSAFGKTSSSQSAQLCALMDDRRSQSI